MTAQDLDFPPDFSGEVRLFPLSDLVMFPSNVLPLHIFESRYKEMFEDALRGDRLVAMATLMPGFEHDYYGRPPVCPAICIGRVISHQRTPQGTYNLMLVGLERAQIEHEIEPVRSFRRGKVTVIGSRTEKAMTESAERAEQLVAQIVKRFPAMRRLFAELAGHEIPLAALTDVAAFHLPLKMELKLQLLAETDPTLRAELLLANYPWTESLESDSGRYRGDFSAN